MVTVRPLFRDPALFIGDARCRSHRSGFGATEVAGGFSVILPRSGVFVCRVRGEQVVCDANHALLLNRDEPYRVSHPVDGGDRCTVLVFGETLFREVLTSLGDASAEHPRLAFDACCTPTEPETHGWHRRLVDRLARMDGRGLDVEEASLALVGRIVTAGRRSGNSCGPSRAETRARRRALAEAVKEILATRFAERVALDELADELACSRFHLCRVFRLATGSPIHRYQNRLRVRAAEERLAAGEQDLTRLALELGFADHSHFTHAFRHESGQTPSAFRRALA